MATPKKYEHINFVPPVGVSKAAEKGLELRAKASPSNRGGLTPSQAGEHGIGSGVQRAVNLKNRTTVSPKVVKQMKAFFARHEKNKGVKEENKGTPWNDKGYVAWLLWGGDPGKTWAEKIVGQMEKADEKEKQSKKASDNVPDNPKLWAKVIKLTKGELKSLSGNGKTFKTPNADNPDKPDGFTKYPSAYANGWASNVYKELGGTWSKKKKANIISEIEKVLLYVSSQRVTSLYLAKGKAKKDVGKGGLDEWLSGHGQGKSKNEGKATWGDWVAISPVKRTITKEDGSKKTYEPGDIIGPCGTVSDDDDWKDLTNNGKSPFKCMARPKAHKIPKKERADLAKNKQKAEKGNNTQKPTNTPTFKKDKKAMVQKRVFHSPKPFEGFRNVRQERKPTFHKPKGLWYSCGNSWKDFASNEMRGGMLGYSHLYEIEINPSKMLIIKDSRSFLAFEREFATPDPKGFDDRIDWYRVSQKYDGIEICPYLGQFRMDHFWYYSWDVASGCIWGSGAIKKVREIPLNTKLANISTEDTMKSLIRRVASRHLQAKHGGYFIDRSTTPSTFYITDGDKVLQYFFNGRYKRKFTYAKGELPIGVSSLPIGKEFEGIHYDGPAVSEFASVVRNRNVVLPSLSEVRKITFSNPFDPFKEWDMAIGMPMSAGEPTGIPSIDKKGATRNKYQILHMSYSNAMNEAYEYAEKNGYEVDEDDIFQSVSTGRGKPKEGETRKHSLGLWKNGKKQRKYLQVQVYRRDNYTYELNAYIL